MAIQRMDHVGIVVADVPAASAFFIALGFEVLGDGSVEGEWVDRIVGLDGVHSDFAMLKTPDGHGRIELVGFRSPPLAQGDPDAPANVPGLRHLAFQVDDIEATVATAREHGGELVREIVAYDNTYKLCYLRGPEGIIIEFAEPIAG
jgi:catechol 2,3-dioxygenase-like lactoylglutathione lyase family enzyme